LAPGLLARLPGMHVANGSISASSTAEIAAYPNLYLRCPAAIPNPW